MGGSATRALPPPGPGSYRIGAATSSMHEGPRPLEGTCLASLAKLWLRQVQSWAQPWTSHLSVFKKVLEKASLASLFAGRSGWCWRYTCQHSGWCPSVPCPASRSSIHLLADLCCCPVNTLGWCHSLFGTACHSSDGRTLTCWTLLCVWSGLPSGLS